MYGFLREEIQCFSQYVGNLYKINKEMKCKNLG